MLKIGVITLVQAVEILLVYMLCHKVSINGSIMQQTTCFLPSSKLPQHGRAAASKAAANSVSIHANREEESRVLPTNYV